MAETKPLVSPKLAAIAGTVSALLAAVAGFLPTVGGVSLTTVALILAFLCAGLAGYALPQVKFGSGKPIVPLTLVPLFASAVPVIMQVATVTEGVLSVTLQGLAFIAAFLAGLASPEPVLKVNPEAKKVVQKELSR